MVRASFDRFSADGIYPFAGAETMRPSDRPQCTSSARGGASGRGLTRALPGRQVLTAGAEFIDNVHQDQQVDYSDPGLPGFIENGSSTQHAVYVQDEIKVARWLIVNGGLRYDGYEDFQRVTPRAAVIVMPSPNQSFKYLYGSAFRAPNAYELNTFYFGVPNLRPESIDTHELVWERYTNDWLRTSVSTYWYKADQPDHARRRIRRRSSGVTYVNEGRVRAKRARARGADAAHGEVCRGW